ncbi:hypothetical protein ACOSQ3_031186 [Xanthoceras sorbifolium]
MVSYDYGIWMRTTSPSRTLPPRVRRDFTKETTGIPAMAENNREVRSNLPDKQWSSTAVDVSTGSGLKAGAVEDIMHDPNDVVHPSKGSKCIEHFIFCSSPGSPKMTGKELLREAPGHSLGQTSDAESSAIINQVVPTKKRQWKRLARSGMVFDTGTSTSAKGAKRVGVALIHLEGGIQKK